MSLVAIILLILAFFGLGTFSASSVAVEPVATVEIVRPAVWQEVDVEGRPGVIVPADEASGFGISGPYWMPSLDELEAAEQAVAEAEGDLQHYRQYAGFTEDGERKILINGFCSEEPNWTSQIVFVLDGGECYFTAIYNVETSELESFYFNGDA